MMVKVIKPFRDKLTGKIYLQGEVFFCSDSRFEQLAAAGRYVETVCLEVSE